MDFERARFNMIEQQIRTWEVLDPTVLDLLYTVRREEFVPEAHRSIAFTDMDIPLLPNGAANETMLQPKLEARVLQEVAPKRTERVLEIGAGSGYMAALLAARSAGVVTVEINPTLHAMAERNLARAGVANVIVELGDGARGWHKQAPYDVIVMSGSLPVLPDGLLASLQPGGRLFAIVGDAPAMAARLYTRVSGGFDHIDLFETSIAPLTNAAQPERFVF